MRKPLSIRAISLMTIAVVAVISIVLTALFAAQYTRLQEQLIHSRFEGVIHDKAVAIETRVTEAEHNVARIKAALTLLDTWEPDKARAYLERLMAEIIQFQPDQYDSFFAFAPRLAQKYFGQNGYVLTVVKDLRKRGTASYGRPEDSITQVWMDPQYQNNDEEVWYTQAQKSREVTLTTAYFDKNYMKLWMISVVQGLYTGDRFEGLVGIDLLLDGLLEKVEQTAVGETGGLLVVDNESGLILTKARSGLMEVGERFREYIHDKPRGREVWVPLVENDTPLAVVESDQGERFVVTSKRLDKLPWTLIAYQNQDEMHEALYASLWSHALLGLTLIAFLSAVSYLSFRNLTRPLARLVDVMKQVKGANVIQVQAPILGTAETRELGGIFNHMIGAIGQAVEEKDAYAARLEDTNHTLESRVVERTRALREQNLKLEGAMARLKETQAQLVEKEKLASLVSVTSGIAHEIKNPLNFVNNFSELSSSLLEELNEELENERERMDPALYERLDALVEMLTHNVGKIGEHGRRADSIVRNMQMHSRARAAEARPTPLNALLEEHVELAYEGMRTVSPSLEVRIHKDLDPTLEQVTLVPQDFGRAILNLINNSLYAVAEKKMAAGEGFTPQVTVSSRRVGSRVEIRIRDNGTGIPLDIRDKIFNPFFTTKPAGSGTGLGLSLTYEIVVQRHRGELRVDSEEGQYTEFLISLPLHVEDPGDPTPSG
jgi:signal transduction histidine kinase